MSNDFAKDYIDVAERIVMFRELHPHGSLQPENPSKPYTIEVLGDQTWIIYTACAYRTPDDERPGIGIAAEPYPGRTPYTRNSEFQNAETSAWGRAIVAALAADTKRGIASHEEVRNRKAEQDDQRQPAARGQAQRPAPEQRRPSAPTPASGPQGAKGADQLCPGCGQPGTTQRYWKPGERSPDMECASPSEQGCEEEYQGRRRPVRWWSHPRGGKAAPAGTAAGRSQRSAPPPNDGPPIDAYEDGR